MKDNRHQSEYDEHSEPVIAIRAAGSSMTGTRHNLNEDRFYASAERGIFVVADGMGGMRGAAQAAQCAVDRLGVAFQVPDAPHDTNEPVINAMRSSFTDANQMIVGLARTNPRLFGMGTTAVMAVIQNQRAYVGAIGDSRAYLWRDGCVWQYTVDHTMAQALVSSGVISAAAARHHRWRHRLWKYLGHPDLTEGPEVSVIRLEPHDRLLLVTDGVTEALDRHMLAQLAGLTSTPADTARVIVQAAAAAGSHDDITCVALHADLVPTTRPECTPDAHTNGRLRGYMRSWRWKS